MVVTVKGAITENLEEFLKWYKVSGNLRTHNTIKTDCQKVTCSEDSAIKQHLRQQKLGARLKVGSRWAH